MWCSTTSRIGNRFPPTPIGSSPWLRRGNLRCAYRRSRSVTSIICCANCEGTTSLWRSWIDCADLLTVAAVDEPEIRAAFESRFRDFEDAIQHFAAKAEGGVSTIITRNKTDFAASEIPVLAPDDYLARLGP